MTEATEDFGKKLTVEERARRVLEAQTGTSWGRVRICPKYAETLLGRRQAGKGE